MISFSAHNEFTDLQRQKMSNMGMSRSIWTTVDKQKKTFKKNAKSV